MRKFLLALPFLALLAFAVPAAHADDYHRRDRGYNRHHYESRRSYSRHEYRHARRHYYYRHGRRYYGYYDNGPYYRSRNAISINLGL